MRSIALRAPKITPKHFGGISDVDEPGSATWPYSVLPEFRGPTTANGSVPAGSAAYTVHLIMMAPGARRCGMKKVTAKKAGSTRLTAGSRRLWIEWCW